MTLFAVKDTFRVAREFQPVVGRIGLTAEGVFTDPRIVAWRKLEDRENCTLDADADDGSAVRLHVKRYFPARGFTTAAEDEVKGYQSLAFEKIPTAPLVGWGKLVDGRSFTIWQDLAGYTPADKLVAAGVPFDRLLVPTADLAAHLHRAGLHHRDLYLCHFMVKLGDDGDGGTTTDVRLIDTARVRRLGGLLTRRRWIVKDLAQFWYSTTKLPVTDDQRSAWLKRYAEGRGDGTTAAGLRGAIGRKLRRIARHDRHLNAAQPARNISIPAASGGSGQPGAAASGNGAGGPSMSAAGTARTAAMSMSQGNTPATLPPTFRVRPATPDDAEALIAHVHRLCEEPDICIAIAAGEFDMTVEQERQFLADMAASDNSTFLVAEADGQVVGSLHCTGGKRRSVRHVTTLGISVRREWRGRGVGSALLAAAVDWAKGTGVVTRIELAVFARNDGAVRLYERFGFVTEGRRRRAVLRNGRYEDDLVMGLLL